MLREEFAKFSPFSLLYKEAKVLTSWVNPFTFGKALKLLAEKMINVDFLISQKFKLSEAEKGMKIMERKTRRLF